MIPIESAIENQVFSLEDLEAKLKPLGLVIGSNWDFDHGYFDYKMPSDGEYYFLRIPFRSEIGQLDEAGTVVRVGKPFLLGHQYNSGTDDEAIIGNFTASFNQFQSPTDPDSDIPKEYVDMGTEFMKTIDRALLS